MPSPTVNDPAVIDEVRAVFERYEQALVGHDVSSLNAFFWDSADCLRYGVAEHSHGIVAIRAYRSQAAPVPPGRSLRNTVITTFGRDAASVCTEFANPTHPEIGRQTQTWVRFAEGWKIVAAHVSLVDPARLTEY